jgi:aldehyde dehydrogenase (NAD+)
VGDVNEAIQIIRGRPIPLVIYVFTENKVTSDLCEHHHFIFSRDADTYKSFYFLVVRKTRSGQLIMNDTFQQVGVYELPFGGCGESGCKFLYPMSAYFRPQQLHRWVISWKVFFRFLYSPSWVHRCSYLVSLTLLSWMWSDLYIIIRMEPFIALRYPPYTEDAYNSALTAGSRTQIPAA